MYIKYIIIIIISISILGILSCSSEPNWIKEPNSGLNGINPNLTKVIIFKIPGKMNLKSQDIFYSYYFNLFKSVKINVENKEALIKEMAYYISTKMVENDRYYDKSRNILYIRATVNKNIISQRYGKVINGVCDFKDNNQKALHKSNEDKLYNNCSIQFENDSQSGFCEVNEKSITAARPGMSY